MRVLVVNAGSSSLKVNIVEDGETVESRDGLPAVAPMVDAVGHRIDLVRPIDLVLIATEGHRAIDVFHITKAGGKLSDADQLELAAH